MATVRKAEVKIFIDGTAVENSLKGISEELRRETNLWAQMEKGTEKWIQQGKKVAQITELKKNFVQEQKNIVEGYSKMSNSASRFFEKIKLGFAVFAGNMMTKAFSFLQGSLMTAFNTIKDFEQANANLATVLGTNRKSIEALTNNAKQLGVSTEWSAAKVTELQTELAKLGFSQNEILNATKPILGFATALGADLPAAAEVVLQKNFSIQLIEENPFFTRNGKKTFDITLSLKNKINAKIYKHCHRKNNNTPIPLNRSARLIANNHVLLIGTEIILDISDTEVKIQLVAGESEMNFLTSDRKINKLDLGDITDNMYKLIPFFSTSIDEIIYDIPHAVDDPSLNHAFINCQNIWQPENNAESPEISASMTNMISQPPLYHIINLVLKSFGYDIVSNILENSDFKYLYLLNGNFTKYYSKMLPDWTVSEFFEEIEKLFNVIFIVDEHSKRVDICFKKDFYNTEQIIFIDKVLDNYNQKIDPENRTDYSNANTGYNLDSDEYFKFQNIDSEILKHVVDTVHFQNFNAIVFHFILTADKESLKGKIFVSDDTNTQYICYWGERKGKEDYYPRKVNAFEPIRNNPKSTDIEGVFYPVD